MAKHDPSVGKTDEWYTPPSVFDALGAIFDLDVASPGPLKTPWIPADYTITKSMDGLRHPWKGFVWMNAPFGGRNALMPWLERFVRHGNGVCFVPDRTSAPWWQKYAPAMDLILFTNKKIRMIGEDGKEGPSPTDGTCLMAIGEMGQTALFNAKSRGFGFLMKAA